VSWSSALDRHRRKRVLAVASGGGHYAQLRRIRPAWRGCDVHYVSTLRDYASQLEPEASFSYVNDANRNAKSRVLVQAVRMLWIVIRIRPDIVVTTGAAPGYFAIRFGKLLGARTIWIDSIANANELSMTGQLARKHSDLWLTQWPELAGPGGPEYLGAIL